MKKYFQKRHKEITLIEIRDVLGKKYKVTKRLPDYSVAETRVFRYKKRALKQFEKWLE